MIKLCSLLMGIGLAGFLLALPGCGCWTDQAKANTPACVVAHAVVDCTVSAGKTYGPDFITVIGKLLQGMPVGQIDWAAIETSAEALGLKDGGCFLAEMKNLVFTKATGPAAEESARQAVGVLDTYKKRKFGDPNVKFKIKAADGREVLL